MHNHRATDAFDLALLEGERVVHRVPGVGLADNAISLGQVQVLSIAFRQLDVLVQVALPGRLNDGVADGRAPARLSQGLVAGDQLLQLLHTCTDCE